MKKIRIHQSLGTRLGLVYTLLAVLNLVFISIMILENQTDMLNEILHFRSDDTVRRLTDEIKMQTGDRMLSNLPAILKKYSIASATVFDTHGKIILRISDQTETAHPQYIDTEIRRKALETQVKGSVFIAPYRLQLNESNFGVEFIIPLQISDDSDFFLHTDPILLGDVTQRIGDLRKQIAFAITWVVVFHLIFAVYAVRVFFRRIGLLTQASQQLSSGKLDARAEWNEKIHDEIDLLKNSFNNMAGRIEGTIQTIQELNEDMHYELSVGKEVQEHFLPSAELLRQMNASVYYRPLREVSGDIYEFYPLRNGKRMFFFADASGHGVSAALVTSIAVMIFEPTIRKTLRLERIFSELNNILAKKFKGSLFYMTGVLIMIDPSGTIEYINAGHPAPILLDSQNDDLTELPATSPPLGMIQGAEYRVTQIPYNYGDRLLVYSDGLVETNFNSGEQINSEVLGRILRANRSGSVDDTLNQMTINHRSNEAGIKDDITAVLMELGR